MKINKLSVVAIIILSSLALTLGGCDYIIRDNIVDDNNDTINNQEPSQPTANLNQENCDNNKPITYTYEDINGLYKFVGEAKIDEFGNKEVPFYTLYLYENGTYNYRYGIYAAYGTMGNYIIKDNTIHLNYLFSTGTSAEICVISGSKTLTITDENTIVDTDQPLNGISEKTATLKKAPPEEERVFLESEDFSHKLKKYFIVNDALNH